MGVFQKADNAAGFALAIQAERVIAHLHHPEFAIGPPLEGDGVEHQRFAGDQFHLEAGPDLDAGQRFLGRFRGRLIRSQKLLERTAIHDLGQPGRIFILHPHLSRMKPNPIVPVEWRR